MLLFFCLRRRITTGRQRGFVGRQERRRKFEIAPGVGTCGLHQRPSRLPAIGLHDGLTPTVALPGAI
jgi:hypothetical protein